MGCSNTRHARLHSVKLRRGTKRRKPPGPRSGGFAYDDPRRSHFPTRLKEGNESHMRKGNAGAAPRYSDQPAST